MTVAITGATGQLGRLVINKLKGKVSLSEIIALARTPASALELNVSVQNVFVVNHFDRHEKDGCKCEFTPSTIVRAFHIFRSFQTAFNISVQI